MDLEIKKIIDLHKIDQQILEIHDSKGALPGIIEKQENKCCNFTTCHQYNTYLKGFKFKKHLKMLIFPTF